MSFCIFLWDTTPVIIRFLATPRLSARVIYLSCNELFPPPAIMKITSGFFSITNGIDFIRTSRPFFGSSLLGANNTLK